MKIVPFAANCPKLKNVKLLPSQVQSAVSARAFQVFVSALGGTDPALTTKNMSDLPLLGEEFGVASLISQVTAFISTYSVVDGQARRRVSDLEEKDRQQTRKYCLLEKEAVDLREAIKAQKEEIGALGRS